MITRFNLTLGAFIALCLLLPLSAAAQETDLLDQLQERNFELLEKLKDTTVAIHCDVETGRRTAPSIPGRRRPGRSRSSGYFGTGAVISQDGLILTSTSVVPPKAKNIKAYFSDGRVEKAKLVGYEERNNVALIKMDVSDHPFLEFGSSREVKVGDLAYTLGNPYDCIMNDRQVAFSMGLVSGIYRLRGDGDYTGQVIETDAALNAGSDGGPLVDTEGKIIGVLNLSYSYSKWLNTSVPIDQVALILEDIKEGSKIYPRYGLSIADEAEPYGGVALTKVVRNAPARNAGLRRGDIIIEIDNLPVNSPDALAEELAILPPGSEITFLIRRGEDEMVVKLTSDKFVQKVQKKEPRDPGTMGISVIEENDGLHIDKTYEGGAAEEAGLMAGDILLEIEGEVVATLDEIAGLLENYFAGDSLEVLVSRNGEKKTFKVTLKKKE